MDNRRRISIKAERGIELLHNKVNALSKQEIVKLIHIIERLSSHLAPGLVASIEANGGIA